MPSTIRKWGEGLSHGNTRIVPNLIYEVRSKKRNAKGQTYWETLKTAYSEKKALSIAKRYEESGLHIQVFKIAQ